MMITAKLALSLAPGVGPVTFQKILTLDRQCTWYHDKSRLKQLPICAEAYSFLSKTDHGVDKILEWAQKPQHHLFCLDDPNYPKLLKQIHDPPPFLYVQGNPQNLQEPQLGIVGCRDMSAYGQTLAFRFAKDLAGMGITITSGLALGIDGVAHQGALQAQGLTIAVLGTGLNKIYPEVHSQLSQEIIAKGGSLVTEFPPDIGIKRENFPRRNRVISGLALGVLVVEAAQKSGSLITAKYALEQNRPVFAIPGSINSRQSRGCHQLIREGALLVEDVNEILTELYQPLSAWSKGVTKAQALDNHDNMNEITLDLLANLRFNTPKSLDELALELGDANTVKTLQKELLALELAGKIKRVPGGYLKLKDESSQ